MHFFGFFNANAYGLFKLSGWSEAIKIAVFRPWALAGIGIGIVAFIAALINRKQDDKLWFGALSLMLLNCSAFVFAIALLRFNGVGGGAYYLQPVIVLLILTLALTWQRMPQMRWCVGLFIIASLCFSYRAIESALTLTEKIVSTEDRAVSFNGLLRNVSQNNYVASESLHLFRTRYAGELIDMGDVVEILTNREALDRDFSATARKHFAEITAHPPEYILSAWTDTQLLQGLAHGAKYVKIAEVPESGVWDVEKCALYQRVKP